MSNTPIEQARFAELDSWRGLCALAVAAFHFPVTPWLRDVPAFANLYLLVDFFFVLSGFVIQHAYGARLPGASSQAGLSFLVKRIGRVYPLHLLMLVALIGLELIKLALSLSGVPANLPAFTGERSLEGLFYSVFLVQAVGFFPETVWNPPAWSISTEVWTYVLFAAICMGAPRRRFALFAGAIVLGLLSLHLRGDYLYASVDGGLERCFVGFFTGVFVYELYRRAHRAMARAPYWLVSALEIGAVALVVLGLATIVDYAQTPPMVLAFAACVFVFAAGRGALSRLMRLPGLLTLGHISYSIYIIHFPIYLFVFRAAGVLEGKLGFQPFKERHGEDGVFTYLDVSGLPAIVGAYAVVLAGVIAASLMTYRFVETPMRAFARRHADEIAARLLRRSRRLMRWSRAVIADGRPGGVW